MVFWSMQNKTEKNTSSNYFWYVTIDGKLSHLFIRLNQNMENIVPGLRLV